MIELGHIVKRFRADGGMAVESALAQMDKGPVAAVSVVQWLGERIARRSTH